MNSVSPHPLQGPLEWPIFPAHAARSGGFGFARPSSAIGRLGHLQRRGQLSTAMAAMLAGAEVAKVRSRLAFSFRSSGSKLKCVLIILSDGRRFEVVLKCPPVELEIESLFYRELAPQLRIRVPRLLGTLSDRGGNSWMILEFLAPGVLPSGLSNEHLRGALKTLARLHAQFWDSETECGFLPRVTECSPETLSQRLESAIELLCRRQESLPHMPKLVDDELRAALRKVARDPEPILAPLRALPPTLLHGDPNPTNFLFDLRNGGVPATALVDWARVCRGPAIVDVVSFFNYQWHRGFRLNGRFNLGVDLMDWSNFASCYFDELEAVLKQKVDRRAHLEAAAAADLNQTIRWRLIRASRFLDTRVVDLLLGPFGSLMDPLARWTRMREVLDLAVVTPVARLKQNLGRFYD